MFKCNSEKPNNKYPKIIMVLMEINIMMDMADRLKINLEEQQV